MPIPVCFLSALIALSTSIQDPLPTLLLEDRTAAELELATGDTVGLSGVGGAEREFVVGGTYRRPADPSTATLRDYRAILHLPDLQALLGVGDRVDRFSLKIAEGADREAVMARIERLAYGADAHATERVASATSETFRVISRFHRALAIITIAGSGIFLLCLVVLKIEDRRLEGAAMREIGISRRTLFFWTFAETVTMAVVGSLVGLGLGWLGSRIINLFFQRIYDTELAFARVTPALALEVLVIALLIGIGIGVWAGWRLVRTAPMRLRQP